MKRMLSVVMLAACLLLTGCREQEEVPPAPQAFQTPGMTITLTEDFAQKDHASYAAYWDSPELVVLVSLEEYPLFENTDFSSATSTEEYAGLLWNANQYTGNVPLVTENGLQYFDLERESNGNLFRYRIYVFKSAEGFWMVQFAAPTEQFASLEEQIRGYAASIVFDTPYVAPAQPDDSGLQQTAP